MKVANPPLTYPMSRPWRELFTLLSGRRERFALKRLFGFLSHRGRHPDNVSDDDLEQFGVAAADAGVPRSKRAVVEAIQMWNSMRERFPLQWPQISLTVPAPPRAQSLKSKELPDSFIQSMEAFLSHQPQGYFDNPRRKKLSAATSKDRRNKILLLATHATRCGFASSNLTTIYDLIRNDLVRKILEYLWASAGKAASNHNYNLARLLRHIAERADTSFSESLELIRIAESKFWEKTKGMTSKSRRQLNPLMDGATLKRLFDLSSTILNQTNTSLGKISDAFPIQSALAIEILLSAPIRSAELAGLDAISNIKGAKKKSILHLLPRGESRHCPTQFALSSKAQQILDIYLNIYYPLLSHGKTSKLFISRTGRLKTPSELGHQICDFLSRKLAIPLTIETFRHLAAYIYLRKNPTDYETVRQFLGHVSVATTREFYSSFEHIHAAQYFDQIIND